MLKSIFILMKNIIFRYLNKNLFRNHERFLGFFTSTIITAGYKAMNVNNRKFYNWYYHGYKYYFQTATEPSWIFRNFTIQ